MVRGILNLKRGTFKGCYLTVPLFFYLLPNFGFLKDSVILLDI